MDAKELGKKLRKIRKLKKLTTTEVAARSGLGQSSISVIENGLRDVTLDSLYKICHALDIEINELLSPHNFPEDILLIANLCKKLTPEERKHLLLFLEAITKES